MDELNQRTLEYLAALGSDDVTGWDALAAAVARAQLAQNAITLSPNDYRMVDDEPAERLLLPPCTAP